MSPDPLLGTKTEIRERERDIEYVSTSVQASGLVHRSIFKEALTDHFSHVWSSKWQLNNFNVFYMVFKISSYHLECNHSRDRMMAIIANKNRNSK